MGGADTQLSVLIGCAKKLCIMRQATFMYHHSFVELSPIYLSNSAYYIYEIKLAKGVSWSDKNPQYNPLMLNYSKGTSYLMEGNKAQGVFELRTQFGNEIDSIN